MKKWAALRLYIIIENEYGNMKNESVLLQHMLNVIGDRICENRPLVLKSVFRDIGTVL